MKLSILAQKIGLEISSEIEIFGLNTLKNAQNSELSFFENSKYLEDLKITSAGAVLVNEEFAKFVPSGCIAVVTEEPYLKLAFASKLFAPKIIEGEDAQEAQFGENCQIQRGAFVGRNSLIGDNVIVMAGAFVGDNCEIGSGTIIYPNVTIYRDSKIGQNCIIHANTVVGSDGFGFAHNKLGEHIKIYQNGNVVIEDNVEIGSNTSIDRAVFGSTIIKKGTKIDNLVQIGHNCIIEEHCIIVSQVGISGSSHLGRNVIMGGQSATSGHLKIAPFTTIAARGGVTKSIDKKGTYAGFPLYDHREWLKLQGKIAKLLQ